MAPAEGADDEVPSVSPGRHRSGRRRPGAPAVPCRGEALPAAAGTPWWRWRRRRRKRTVAPVDGAVDGVPDDVETRRGEPGPGRASLLRSCCFLPLPSCLPGPARKKSVKRSSNEADAHQKQQRGEEEKQPQQPPEPPDGRNPPCEAPSARQREHHRAATALPRRRAEPPLVAPRAAAAAPGAGKPRARASSSSSSSARDGYLGKAVAWSAGTGAGELGPAAGLTVVAAVSMAGLLGGRLWAILCVAAWFLTLSMLRRKAAAAAAAKRLA